MMILLSIYTNLLCRIYLDSRIYIYMDIEMVRKSIIYIYIHNRMDISIYYLYYHYGYILYLYN